MATRSWMGLAIGLGLTAVALQTGCQRGVRWELGSYRDAHARAADASKLTFAYFRNWYSVECTRFEDNVLKDPEVLAETDKFVCVPLEYGPLDRPLAQRWGLDKVPAYAVVTPDDRVLAAGTAPITKAELLEALRGALVAWQPATQPVAAP